MVLCIHVQRNHGLHIGWMINVLNVFIIVIVRILEIIVAKKVSFPLIWRTFHNLSPQVCVWNQITSSKEMFAYILQLMGVLLLTINFSVDSMITHYQMWYFWAFVIGNTVNHVWTSHYSWTIMIRLYLFILRIGTKH